MKLLIGSVITLALVALSCEKNKTENVENDSRTPLSYEDMPNEKTTYDTIYTVDSPDNTKLIEALEKQLKTDHFTVKLRDNTYQFSVNNCVENKKITLKGEGIREYFARSTKPEKGTTDYYADFVLRVYEFANDEMAKKNYHILNEALNSPGKFCNGKSSDRLILNGRELFFIGTRAEMFSTYTKRYADFIQNYK